MTSKNLAALFSCTSLMALAAGCTPAARDDVGKAGDNLNNAAVESAQGTKQAVDQAGAKVTADAKDAAAKTEVAVDTAGAKAKAGADAAVQKTETAVATAGADAKAGADAAVQGTEKAAAKAGSDVKTSTAALTLTPSVKSAILVDERVKMPDLNIDTKADTKQVVVNGTASSAEMKKAAMEDARKALDKAKSSYSLVDKITVGSSPK